MCESPIFRGRLYPHIPGNIPPWLFTTIWLGVPVDFQFMKVLAHFQMSAGESKGWTLTLNKVVQICCCSSLLVKSHETWIWETFDNRLISLERWGDEPYSPHWLRTDININVKISKLRSAGKLDKIDLLSRLLAKTQFELGISQTNVQTHDIGGYI